MLVPKTRTYLRLTMDNHCIAAHISRLLPCEGGVVLRHKDATDKHMD